jgi:heavy metal efflux system protein
VIPVATSFLLKSIPHHEPWLIRSASRLYAPALVWALANERKVMIAAVVALVAAGFAYTRLGKTFMPTMDEGDIIVSVETLPSVNLDEALALNARIQSAILAKVPDVTGIVARTGSDELGLDPMRPNQSDTFLVLKPVEERKTSNKSVLLQQLREVLAEFSGRVAELYPTDRHARAGDDQRRAWRRGGQALRPRHCKTERDRGQAVGDPVRD